MNRWRRALSKVAFGIFLTNEEVPYTASDYRDKITDSRFRWLIGIPVLLFWFFLAYLLYTSFRFFITPDTLYHISAKTETFSVAPYRGEPLKPLSLVDANFYPGCMEPSEKVNGTVSIAEAAEVFFDRVGNGPLLITLSSQSLDAVGTLELSDGTRQQLSDCAVFEFPVSIAKDYTIPFDGIVTLGGELKELSTREPILHRGTVTISDKGAVSGQYYQTDPISLERGDKFFIQKPSVQSSGFLYVDGTDSIDVIYNGKGSAGIIQRYKSENVVLKNTIWTKLSNDESIIFLWLFLVAAFTFLKFMIRIAIE